MNIKLDNYYVTRGLNVVLAKDKVRNDQTRMISPDYFKNINWFGVYKEGNYYINKSESFKDIMEELTSKTNINDIYIIDLFQLAEYTLNTLYTTAKDKNESVKVYDSENSKIKIYHSSTDKVLYYPVVSIFGAMNVSNKRYRLHKALKGF